MEKYSSLTVFRINQTYSLIEPNSLIQYKCWSTLKWSFKYYEERFLHFAHV